MTEDEYEWGPLTSGPTVPIAGRSPDSQSLKRYPSRIRVANVFCRRKRRQLLAVVLGAPGHYIVPTTEGTVEDMSVDEFLVSCRCGWDHVIVGPSLALAVTVLARAGRAVPEIWVDTVERAPD